MGQLCYTADVPLIGENGTFNIAEHRGKMTILNFWGTWCGPCMLELPDFDLIATEYADQVNVVALHSDYCKENAYAYVQENFPNSKIIFGVDTAEAYYTKLGGDGSYPMTWILDENGVIIAKYVGMINYSILREYLK